MSIHNPPCAIWQEHVALSIIRREFDTPRDFLDRFDAEWAEETACYICHRRPATLNVDRLNTILGVCDTCWERNEDERRDWAPGELMEAWGK